MAGEPGERTRLLSFNVNGLRALLAQRLHVTLKDFLDSLGADVVCLQETKLRRCDIDRDLAVAEGWDAFFSCAQSATGYSGTATYVRTAKTLPFAAEEGFTGCAALVATAASAAGIRGSGAAAVAAAAVAEPHPALAEHFTVEELMELDREGRVVVTDHGAFVLFNIYGPAITNAETSEDRLQFKMRFFQALELRWLDLLRRGRAVVACGDLNICPAPIDSCDFPMVDPLFFRPGHPRLWLRRLLHGSSGGSKTNDGGGDQLHAAAAAAAVAAGGNGVAASYDVSGSCGGSSSSGSILVDTFRTFHPARQRAFTCWSTATNARVLNHGSRIDLILTAGLSVGSPPTQPADAAAAVATAAAAAAGAPGAVAAGWQQQAQQQEDEGMSRFGSSDSGAGGGGISQPALGGVGVWVAASDIWSEQQGSDHCPVWADFACCGRAAFPCATTVPPVAMRFVFGGKQLKLHGWLQRSTAGPQPQARDAAANMSDRSLPPLPLAATEQQLRRRRRREQQMVAGPSSSLASRSKQHQVAALGPGSFIGVAAFDGRGGSSAPGAAAGAAPAGKKQATLKSLFQRQQQPEGPPSQWHQPPQQQQVFSRALKQPACSEQPRQQQQGAAAAGPSQNSELLAAEIVAADASRQQSVEVAKDAWRSIQQRFQVPRCKHGEAAVLKRVNKSGPNKGRYFYTCSRPEGRPPEGKCEYFKWVERREGDHALTTLPTNKDGGGGGGSGLGVAAKRAKT